VGVLEPGRPRAAAWVAVRTLKPAAPQAKLLAAGRTDTAIFPIRSLQSRLLLALGEAKAPGARHTVKKA
jgi:hypothetical protein